MVPITDAELRSPYYRFFLRETAPYKHRLCAEMDENWEPTAAFYPEDINELFRCGALPLENGFCILKNGTVVVACRIPMPGVTPEMFDWWFAWHGLDPMRFKLWNHDDHYYCKSRDRDTNLNKNLSMRQRWQNTIHDTEEDIGAGCERFTVHYREAADIGFDPELLKEFDGSIVCTGDASTPVVSCAFLRPTEDGSELRLRVWLGYSLGIRRAVKVLPEGVKLPVELARRTYMNNAKKFANLAALLPELYECFGRDF